MVIGAIDRDELQAELEADMRKVTRETGEAFLARKAARNSNTVSDGEELRLHGNAIAWWHQEQPDTQPYIVMTLAGWNTVTTRDRLNGLLELMGALWRISTAREDGEDRAYLRTPGGMRHYIGDSERLEFTKGGIFLGSR